MLIIRLMHIADMPSISELVKRDAAGQSKPTTIIQPAANAPAPATPKFRTIASAADLATALQESKEILLYSYYSSNIEIAEFSNGAIKYFDRKGDGDFAPKLSAWLRNKTGNEWRLERVTESVHTQTITEQSRAEIEADPMVANAMSLFEDAQIIGVTK